MLAIAIQICWLLVYALCLCGVVWLVLYGIRTFIYAMPPIVEQGIWFIVLLLVVIAVLTMLAGGGGIHAPSFR